MGIYTSRVIPGASSEVLEMIGYLCDRMSVNLELPTAEGLRAVAPNKARKNHSYTYEIYSKWYKGQPNVSWQ